MKQIAISPRMGASVRYRLTGGVLTTFVALAAGSATQPSNGGQRVAILEPPGRAERASISGDTAILVNGRRVTPAGRVLRTQSYAWGLALSPDGSRAAVLNKDAFELVDLREPFVVRRVPPLEPRTRNSEAEPRTRNPEPR